MGDWLDLQESQARRIFRFDYATDLNGFKFTVPNNSKRGSDLNLRELI